VAAKSRPTKYIFVTGGVVSSLGKGLTCASLAALLESRGLKVAICKVDPYLNVDPGTMSPFQHGEVFVTDDGAETDLDLGHYERFSSSRMTRQNNFTAGQVYDTVIRNERRGEYLGGTVQVIPHVTDEIKRRLRVFEKDFDIVIAEIGGTVGDIEGLPFLEAIRQFRKDVGPQNVVYMHLTLLPYIPTAGELKSKPTQHSVRELTSLGIQPDIIILRTDQDVDEKIRSKISLYCNVEEASVIVARDVPDIYHLPLVLQKEGLDSRICEKLNIWTGKANLAPWQHFSDVLANPSAGLVRIGMVGKYVDLTESYKSLNEALVHAGVANNARVEIHYIDSGEIEDVGIPPEFSDMDGVIVPGGFGKRGSEGKIAAIGYVRENQIPFLGICLGMQMAVVEFARSKLGLTNAASSEFVPDCSEPVIHLMETQKVVKALGASMRLGAYECILLEGSRAHDIYSAAKVWERHRHRWEFNNSYRSRLEAAGLVASGLSPDGELVEIVELRDHPWFVGVQFHPEFRSRPLEPHPLFSSFIAAALEYRDFRCEENSARANMSGATEVCCNHRE